MYSLVYEVWSGEKILNWEPVYTLGTPDPHGRRPIHLGVFHRGTLGEETPQDLDQKSTQGSPHSKIEKSLQFQSGLQRNFLQIYKDIQTKGTLNNQRKTDTL